MRSIFSTVVTWPAGRFPDHQPPTIALGGSTLSAGRIIGEPQDKPALAGQLPSRPACSTGSSNTASRTLTKAPNIMKPSIASSRSDHSPNGHKSLAFNWSFPKLPESAIQDFWKGSWPIAFFGYPRGHRVNTETVPEHLWRTPEPEQPCKSRSPVTRKRLNVTKGSWGLTGAAVLSLEIPKLPPCT